MQNRNSTHSTNTASMHYARYDSQSKKKSGKNSNSNDSTTERENSRQCFRCGNKFEKGNLKNCITKDVECKFCGVTGHFAKCCGKAGNFPKGGKNSNSTKEKEDSKKSLHSLQVAQTTEDLIQWNSMMRMGTYT